MTFQKLYLCNISLNSSSCSAATHMTFAISLASFSDSLVGIISFIQVILHDLPAWPIPPFICQTFNIAAKICRIVNSVNMFPVDF